VISLGRSALLNEMSFFAAIIILSLLFRSWALSLRLLLKASLFFAECRINFPVYFVGVLLRLSLLKIVMLILAFFFLKSSTEIVVEASGYLN
jgi:hypothetical protein